MLTVLPLARACHHRSEASFLSSTSNSQMFAPDSATNLARTSNSKPVKRGTKPEEADFSSEGLRQELTGQSASRRWACC